MDDAKLTFVIFTIHLLAEKWHQKPATVFQRLESSNLLNGYLIPCYDTLHSLGSQYLAEDLTELIQMREGGIG